MTSMQFWINVLAVALSPLIAVQVSEWLSRRRAARDRRLDVFRTLMTTRATRLSGDHVQALNMIDLEFAGDDRHDRAIREAWKAYLDHLNDRDTDGQVWAARRDELFFEMLMQMAKTLGYSIDKTDLRRLTYFPRGHGQLEEDQYRIRKGILAIVEGRSAVPIVVPPPTEPPSSNPALPESGA